MRLFKWLWRKYHLWLFNRQIRKYQRTIKEIYGMVGDLLIPVMTDMLTEINKALEGLK